jgi:TRAP-type mannitol/chloroaromatic compound transport system substrate-binding protein
MSANEISKNTQRRKLLQTVGLSGAALGAAAMPAMAQGQQSWKWRTTTVVPESSMFYQMAAPFVKRVAEMTGGRVQLQIFPPGVIAPALEGYKAVEDKLADAGHLTPLYVVNRDPVNAYYGGHPGGMPPEMLLAWLYNGGGQALLAEHRRTTMKMHSMVVGVGPAEIWHGHKPIRTAADLKGVKFRASGAWAAILNEKFGAAATTVAGSEVYPMLERKGVDVVEWSGPAENLKMGLQNAAPYIMVPGAHTNAFSFEFMLPIATWDPLPANMKQAIEAAAKLSTLEILLDWTMQDIEAMKKIRAGKAKVIEVDASLIKDIREAGRDWANQKAAERAKAGDNWMKRVTDSYYAFYDSWLTNANYRTLD